MKKQYLVIAQLIILLIVFFSCSPPLHPFLITNQNLNTREHTFFDSEKVLSYKCSAGYRLYYREIGVVARVEIRNHGDETFTLDTRQINFVSTNYSYKVEYISSHHGSIWELYGIEKTEEYDSTKSILEIKPGKKDWLYIKARAEALGFQDNIQIKENEKMILVLGNGKLGHKEISFEEIHFVPEFAIKAKQN